VLFIDIDDFKHVNDGLGHQAGDELLQEIARRLGRATRAHDLVARLGGDEFAVILRHTQPEIAESVATRIVTAVATAVPLSNGVAEVGASVGVAMAEPDCSLDELVRRADVAMYAAKAQGKNQVQPFHPGLLPAERSTAG
jgi:diguanylate cyclase (GGDEF)-like protein